MYPYSYIMVFLSLPKVMQFAVLPTSHKGRAALCCYKMEFCSLVFCVDRFQFPSPCVMDFCSLSAGPAEAKLNWSGVIRDPAPPRIWHLLGKFPRDFGTPSMFLVSPTEQGVRHSMQNSLENLASPCKIPGKFGISIEKVPSIQIKYIKESLLLWHPYM